MVCGLPAGSGVRRRMPSRQARQAQQGRAPIASMALAASHAEGANSNICETEARPQDGSAKHDPALGHRVWSAYQDPGALQLAPAQGRGLARAQTAWRRSTTLSAVGGHCTCRPSARGRQGHSMSLHSKRPWRAPPRRHASASGREQAAAPASMRYSNSQRPLGGSAPRHLGPSGVPSQSCTRPSTLCSPPRSHQPAITTTTPILSSRHFASCALIDVPGPTTPQLTRVRRRNV